MDASEAGGDWDFFVSYAQPDRGWAEWIAWQLEEDGYRVLIQAWDMVAGANWVHRVQDGVLRAARMIAVLSDAYLKSVFGTAEWEAAWLADPRGEQRGLLTFRVCECDRPGLLGGLVSVDLFSVGESAARERVRSAVRGAITGRGKPGIAPTFPPARGARRTGWAGPGFPGAPPEAWNISPRNPNFAGRESELACIREELASSPVVTVHGMGGVGKTQAVIEYAWRHTDKYDLAWWFNAEQAAVIADQLVLLAEELGLPPVASPEGVLAAVCRTLRGRDRWLLVFDNAEDAEQVRALLPGGAGHVLVTTRRAGFRTLGSALDLDVLDRAEAVTLLRRRAPGLAEAQAGSLAARLGDLPLALDQAAAYLDQTGMPTEEYLRLLETRGADLHGRGHAASHPGTVATVWSVSLDRLRATFPAAVQLLELCSWLAPGPIPLDVFTSHCDQLPQPLATAAADPVAFSDTVGALADYSLTRRAGATITVHRLIQDVTRHRSAVQPLNLPAPLEAAVALLQADLPGDAWDKPGSWLRWGELLPSVLTATGHAEASQAGPTAWLLTQAAGYLWSQGRYAEALPLHLRALGIREANLGPGHPEVATELNHIGRALSGPGRYAEALPLHERALRIREAALGPDHPDVATDLNHIGRVMSALVRYGEALPLHERALRIRQTALGPDHPSVATDLNQVGRALRGLGRHAEALPLHQRALRIRQAALGLDHPYAATDLNDVGRALLGLGRHAEALLLQQRALGTREAALGPDHSYVTTDLTFLARTLFELGQYEEALSLQQRALRMREAAFGPDHPYVAADLTFLGRTLSALGRDAEALPLHRRALRIDETAFGSDHRYTCQCRRRVEELQAS